MDFINLIVGLLGVVFVTLSKMRSLQILAEKANVPFVYKKYFQRDALGIIMSILSIFIWQLLFPEVANKYPALEVWVRCSYFFMGAGGAWVIQKLLGKTQSWINSKIDHKTNELDELKSQQ